MKFLSAPVMAFAGRCLAIFLLLAIPWPFLTPIYLEQVQGLGESLFDSQDGASSRSFEFLKNPQRPFDARITLENPAIRNPEGQAIVRRLDFDTRGLFWRPCVLLFALIIATPVAWNRKWKALAFGMPLILLACYLFLRFTLWDEASEIGLVVIPSYWKQIVVITRSALTVHLELAIPILIWLLVTFRKEDYSTLMKLAKPECSTAPKQIR